MAKKRLKNDHLAKLRQFQKGMDVDDYLSNQHRQVIRALEESYVVTDDIDLSPYATEDQLNSLISSTSTPIVSGVHAAKETIINSTFSGNIVFDTWHCPASAGTFTGTLFRPSKDGTYYVEVNFIMAARTNSSFIDPTFTLNIRKEPSTVLKTYYFDKTTTSSVMRSDAFEYYSVSTDRKPELIKTIFSYATLTTSAGAYFDLSMPVTDTSLHKIWCKIYRIGD